MRLGILFLIFTLLSNLGFSQKKDSFFLKSLVFGTSITYKWDGSLFENDFFQEYTWHTNGGISVHKRVIVGVQSLKIFSKGRSNHWNSSYIYGFFTQYDFFPKKDFRLFAELSYNKGNYCTCGRFDPYSHPNLSYIGYGLGFDVPMKSFSENFFLDLAFYNYLILNKIKDKYNYTQYIIGINYYFGKKRNHP